MAINPITAKKLKVIGLVGHSNAEGWGSTDHLFELTGKIYEPKADWEDDPSNAYWKNIYVFTSEQPFPAPDQGENGGNVSLPGDIANGEWLEMTIASPQTPSEPHPHSSPYNYPNNQGSCAPRYLYEAWGKGGNYTMSPAGPIAGPNYSPTGDWFNQHPRGPNCHGVRHGVEIPLMRLYQSYVGEQVGLVKLAVSSTTVQAAEGGFDEKTWLDPYNIGEWGSPNLPFYVRSAADVTGEPYYCYWTPSEKADWSPASERLYNDFARKMDAAAAQLPEGTVMDLDAVVVWFGDNDANTLGENELKATWSRHVRTIINRIRSDAVARGWTTKPAEQVKILWPSVQFAYNGQGSPNWNAPDYCNSVLSGIAENDEYMTVLPVSGWNSLTYDRLVYGYDAPLIIEEGSHYGSSGYEQAARDMIGQLQKMDELPFDAIDLDEAITVDEAKSRVRQYYGRSRGNIDIDDAELLQHLNGAYYHCLNQAGDNVWWLRRREQFSITAGPTAIHTFPKKVDRVLRIEGREDPSYPIQFELIGHSSNGKLQINMSEQASGTFWVQYITVPRRLTSDAQYLNAPEVIVEWIIVETCRRLASSASNEPLAAYYSGESRVLQQDTMRHMGQTQRKRPTRMRTQRRRPNMQYRRSMNNKSWGSDG